MPGSVCLLSAGLDSTVALALEVEQQSRESVVLALTMDYGQRAAAREVDCAQRQAKRYGIRHEVVKLPFFQSFPDNALLDRSVNLPEPSLQEIETGSPELWETAAQVWVPNRNGVLIQVAAAFAEGLGAHRLVVGFNSEEAATFPDNSLEFLQACNQALQFSTKDEVEVVSPTVSLDKAEILREANRLRVPLRFLWSCYEGGRRHCGACESCLRLRRASRRAGVLLPPGLF